MRASQLFHDCVFARTGTVARAPRRRQRSARRASGRPRRREDVDGGDDVGIRLVGGW